MDLPARQTASVDDCLYAAGFFDGEGCISICQTERSIRVQLNVTNTALRPLEWLRDRWGGSIYSAHRPGQGHRQQSWQWTLPPARIALFLEDVLPHLQIKHTAANNAIELLRLKATTPRFGRTETVRAELRARLEVHQGLGLDRRRSLRAKPQ